MLWIGLTIPVPLSPGRAGFTPSLALTYDSGAGNGPCGLGWTLALPAITRRTDRGLPRYLDDRESDVFLLAGAEDLVPVLRSDGSRHDEIRDGFRVRRYRPRVEGLFARIERWTNASDPADSHWRSISRTNVTTRYGTTSASRIADPRAPSRIFSWLPCESFDDKGNAAVFDYVAEDSRNVDLASTSEAGRSGADRAANRYLKRVRYGNRASRLLDPDLAGMEWLFELVVDYGDHDDTEPAPSPSRAWSARPDPFSTYRAGFEVRTHRRCHRFLMFHHIGELSPEPRLALVPVAGWVANVSPIPRIAPPPLGSETDGAARPAPAEAATRILVPFAALTAQPARRSRREHRTKPRHAARRGDGEAGRIPSGSGPVDTGNTAQAFEDERHARLARHITG